MNPKPLTDLNPLAAEHRCGPECPGWFVNSENGRPERCDECARAASARGWDEITDEDAFDAWRASVLELLEDLVTTPADEVAVNLLFPEVR